MMMGLPHDLVLVRQLAAFTFLCGDYKRMESGKNGTKDFPASCSLAFGSAGLS